MTKRKLDHVWTNGEEQLLWSLYEQHNGNLDVIAEHKDMPKVSKDALRLKYSDMTRRDSLQQHIDQLQGDNAEFQAKTLQEAQRQVQAFVQYQRGQASLQVQGNPLIQAQAHPQAHLQAQVNPQAHLQTQVNPQTHLQAHAHPYVQANLQAQFNPQAPLQAQVNPQAHLHAQINPQAQAQAHLQAQQGNPQAHLQAQVNPQAHLQAQAHPHVEANLQVQGNPQAQAHAQANLQIQGNLQVQANPQAQNPNQLLVSSLFIPKSI